MNRYGRPRGGRIFLLILAGIGAVILFTYLVMLLWNGLMPDIFNLGTINFWQALGLLVLSKIFFGFGGGGGGRRRRWRRNIPEQQWAAMTPEEKEKFRQEWRARCGWQRSTGQTQAPPPPDPGIQTT